MNRIPNIIHQTAKTAAIPPSWQAFQQRAKDFHPGWQYRLWTDKDNDQLVANHFPHLLVAFRGLPRGIMRADIIRYALMSQFGGWYLDLDYELLRQLPSVEMAVVLPRESTDTDPVYLGNCIFGSAPGHAFWTAVIDEFLLHHPGPLDTPSEHEITQLTGPGLLTRVWARDFKVDSSIWIPPQLSFNPPIPREMQTYNILKKSDAFGIHHCDGTWRALTIPQRIINRLRTGFFLTLRFLSAKRRKK